MKLRFRHHLVSLLLLALPLAGCGFRPGADATDEHDMTALMRAARDGDVARVREQIREGARLDQTVRPHNGLRVMIAFLSWMQELPDRDDGYTALTYAVSGGHVAVARTLLDAGADPDGGAAGSITPLALAIMRPEQRELVPLLLERGASVHPPAGARGASAALVAAGVGSGDTLILRMLLDAGAESDATVPMGTGGTALILAARAGRLDMVRMLLAAGADAAARDQRGWTAAMWAEAEGHDSVAAAFAASPLAAEAEHAQALLHGVREGDTAAVRAALAAGAWPNIRYETGDPVLFSAVVDGSPDVVRILLEAGADPGLVPDWAEPMIVHAARNARIEAVRLLLQAGASAREPGAMSGAAGTGSIELLRLLREHGGDAREHGDGPLRAAASNGRLEAVRFLLGLGADPNSSDANGVTALDRAVAFQQLEVVRTLIEAGGDVNAGGESGWTPLMSAAMSGDTALIRLLLAAGANPRARDREGKSAADYARGARQEHVLPLLPR